MGETVSRAICVIALGSGLVTSALQANATSAGPELPSPVKGTTPEASARKETAGANVFHSADKPAPSTNANFGTILDEAISLCSRGETERAQQLLLWLDSQADVPVGIAEIISFYRRPEVCKRTQYRYLPRIHVAAGIGIQDNVNLGPSADRIYFAGWGQTLELAPTSRPIDAWSTQWDAALSWDLGLRSQSAKGWTAGMYVQQLQFAGEDAYAVRAAGASLAWASPPEAGSQRLAAQFGVHSASLGDGTRSASFQGSASRLWARGNGVWIGLAGVLSDVRFADRSSLDATQLDLRVRVRHEIPGWQLTTDTGWTLDRQKTDRPGGDRAGPVVQLQGQWLTAPARAVEGSLRISRINDDQPYLPEIFGSTVRKNLTVRAQLSLRQRLGRELNARVEARTVTSRDSLTLFTYASHALMLWLEYNFDPSLP